MSDSIAIAHKDYDVRGGGEMLAEHLAETFDCPLYVGRKVRENQPGDFTLPLYEIDLTWWQRKLVKTGGMARSIAYLLAWSQGTQVLADYDTLICSGNEPLWYVPEDHQTLIAYTHATPRWLTDLWHQRDFTGPFGRLSGLLATCQRAFYQHNLTRPDVWVANSEVVARRMDLYYGLNREDIHVVYPPVQVDSFAPGQARTEDFYLYLGRLDDAKEVGEIVNACTKMGTKLVVAGDGPERDTLEHLAGSTVDILGYVSTDRKEELFSQAKATIFNARNEDFGIVPIESMAAGTPVLGVNEGFTKEQIKHGKNGRLYKRGNILGALREFEESGVEWEPSEIASFADQFNVARFREAMREIVGMAKQGTEVSVKL